MKRAMSPAASPTRSTAPLACLIVLASTAGCMSHLPHDVHDGEPAAFVPTDCLAGLNGIDLNLATIADLQAALTDGRITSLQLVDAYLARIDAFDQAPPTGPLNSIRHLNPTSRDQARALDDERAAGHVRGPLHGIPILLKDNINTFDEPTTAGSIALADNVPPQDATVTARLRAAGAIILGKTNMVEFAGMMTSVLYPLKPHGYSTLGGHVVNAYTGGNPSGSSSGSGVAGSMAFAAITLGTETTASITGPSIFNSLVGLKTTTGLVSRVGVIPLAPSFDTVGPMGRNVADVAATLQAMAGSDPLDARTAEADAHVPAQGFVDLLTADALAGIRLGYEAGDEANPLFAQALETLRQSGAVIVPLDDAQQAYTTEGEPAYEFNEFKSSLNRYLANDAGPDAPEDLTGIILYNQQHMDQVPYGQDKLIEADATPGDATLASLATQPQAMLHKARVDQFFAEHHLDAIVDTGDFLGVGDFIGYPTLVLPIGYANHTQASLGVDPLVPVEYTDHTPYGIGLFGQAWSDGRLLAYAYAYEQATPGRSPPTVENPKLVQGICGS